MRIMAMEWGVEKDAIKRVKEAIVNYKVEREVFVEEEDPLLAVRNSLSYGKLVVRRGTTSYEYYTAFNSAPMVTIITRDLQFLLILTAPPPE